MKALPYSRDEEYQYMNGTLVFWDQRNSRAKILQTHLLSRELLRQIKTQAAQAGAGKIISFTPELNRELFLAEGFVVEGTIAGFFCGQAAICCSFFIDPARGYSENNTPMDRQTIQAPETSLPDTRTRYYPFAVRDAAEGDIADMIRLFRYVFQSYPSPIFEKDYILHNMQNHKVLYKLAVHNDDIIGIASAEMDSDNLNAEMTDCVTYPLYRNRGVLGVLLGYLEIQLRQQNFVCLYTLCRATNPAINHAFARLGYTYSGCLVNNCHICGAYEDMNILVKLIN